MQNSKQPSFLDKIIRFCLENKLVVFLIILFVLLWGILVAPFDWNIQNFPRDPVPVDAIPDIGENQQIVFSEWMGRSPQDVEDQISYPLTVSLLGIPGVKSVRSYSFFGFSSIFIIFQDDIEFYWSRSRILEKLNSLPAGTLPEEVKPALGPDATALGQIFWYTLEGRDENDQPTGGWDLDELRTIQDWYVRYALQGAEGVSENASIGGFVREYQIDVDPDAMRAHRVTLEEIFTAVKMSNVDVGARTIEVNRAEYIIRGLGLLKSLDDIENTVIKVNDHVPITIKEIATVSKGPALRRGALDKEGAETVGGVVVARYGSNPLEVIKNVKDTIRRIAPGLPKKTLSDGRVSQVKVVPFYDRSGLIYETLGTLESALVEEILITIIVVIVMVINLRSSFLISLLLPLAVFMCFIGMKTFKVDANIMSLSGIAIAIGTMVDMGIILCENMLKCLDEADPEENKLEVIYRAATEVAGAVLTAVSTTVVSFLPVFTMTGPEGKLFKPLAYTKSFALISSVIVSLTLLPPLAHILFAGKIKTKILRRIANIFLIGAGIILGLKFAWWIGLALVLFGIYHFVEGYLPEDIKKIAPLVVTGLVLLVVVVSVTRHWLPLGPGPGIVRNMIFVVGICGGLLLFFRLFELFYVPILTWILKNKLLFLSVPLLLIILGFNIWRGLGKEFMPPLDEGSYLFMPTTMPHASIGEVLDVLQKQDRAISNIPEVESVVGKLGRVESPLDPAPISMIETVINYKPEYFTGKDGHRLNFRYDEDKQEFIRDKNGKLIPDPSGQPFRQWRDQIRKPDDIWDEIVRVARIPGTTSAPKLQPIAARIVMLQSGMRAPMGVKIKGPDLETIEKVGFQIERLLKQVPSVEPSAVIADRVVGKPYLEIDIDRKAIARYGIMMRKIQDVIEIAVGGRKITTIVEGRERYPVRVRYARELRDSVESLGKVLIPAMDGTQIPLDELATIRYRRGPQVIKSEDTFLVGYVLLDKKPGYAEVDVVEDCQKFLKQKIADGEFKLPAGVNYTFAGNYVNQIRSEKTLMIVLPIALFLIFLILYFQFKDTPTTMLVFVGIIVAWSGGFLMMWLYGQPWFLNFSIFGVNMRELFQVHPINLSVAVWVGFIALFGIASDDGVVIATYLKESFAEKKIESIEDIRRHTVVAGHRRLRPCLMTTATTILALIPVLTSSGRGADIMVPMAVPSFGGMSIELITLFVVPTLYCWIEEMKFKFKNPLT